MSKEILVGLREMDCITLNLAPDKDRSLTGILVVSIRIVVLGSSCLNLSLIWMPNVQGCSIVWFLSLVTVSLVLTEGR